MVKLPRLARSAFIVFALCAGTAEVKAISILEIGKLELMIEDLSQPDGHAADGPR